MKNFLWWLIRDMYLSYQMTFQAKLLSMSVYCRRIWSDVFLIDKYRSRQRVSAS